MCLIPVEIISRFQHVPSVVRSISQLIPSVDQRGLLRGDVFRIASGVVFFQSGRFSQQFLESRLALLDLVLEHFMLLPQRVNVLNVAAQVTIHGAHLKTDL